MKFILDVDLPIGGELFDTVDEAIECMEQAISTDTGGDATITPMEVPDGK